MKRTARKVTVKARALTDPDPSFVTLCKGGANQRPFRAVKMDPQLVAEGSSSKKEDHPMSKKTIVPPEGFDIVSLKFTGDAFADQAAVEKWLKDGGYEEYDIAQDEGGFIVLNKFADFEAEGQEEVEGTIPGLTVVVGKLKVEEVAERTPAENATANATGNASSVQPVATASKAASDEVTLEEAIKVIKSFDAKVKENVEKGLYETSVLSEVLYSLRWLVEDAEYTGMTDEDVAGVKKAAKLLIKTLGSAMGDTLTQMEEAFKQIFSKGAAPEGMVPEGEEAPPEPKEPEATEKSQPPANEPAPTPEVPEWQAAIAALTKTVGDLAATVEQSLGEVTAKVEKTAASLEQRVEAVETTSQTRKGANVSGTETEATTTDADKERKERSARRLASAVGIQRPSAGWGH